MRHSKKYSMDGASSAFAGRENLELQAGGAACGFLLLLHFLLRQREGSPAQLAGADLEHRHAGFPADLLLPTCFENGMPVFEIRACQLCRTPFTLTQQEVEEKQEPTRCPACLEF